VFEGHFKLWIQKFELGVFAVKYTSPDTFFLSPKTSFHNGSRISGFRRNSRSNKSLNVGLNLFENCCIRSPTRFKISGFENDLKNFRFVFESLKNSLIVNNSPRGTEMVGIRNISAFVVDGFFSA
jgi:hypothetical protein